MPVRTYVTESSNIKAIGYDPEAHIMEVRFSGGACYRYQYVDPETLTRFMFAESLGSHFAKMIRPNFKGEKVLDVAETIQNGEAA